MRNKLIQIVGILVLSMTTLFGFSQENDSSNDNQLALFYYSQGEYEKAADMYLALFQKTHSQNHFDYLIDCYNELKWYDKAEKITNEQIRHNPKSLYYPIKLAAIYKKVGKTNDANEILDKTVKKANKDIESCLVAGEACIENKFDSVAKIIYENGWKRLEYNGIIFDKLTYIYLKLGEYEQLVNLYMDILKLDKFREQYIEDQLQIPLYEKKNEKLHEILTARLEKEIDKNKQIKTFGGLYLWMQLQEKNFERAYSLAKDIDIEIDSDGNNTFTVGEVALENNDYTNAAKCFSFVVQRGPMEGLYEKALKNLLETSYNKLFKSNQKPEIQQIASLEEDYRKAMDEIADAKTLVEIIKNLAHIQAFYLDKTDEAIDLLKQNIAKPNLRQYKNQLEMELADIYLFTDDIWGANLQYASIALNYKNNDIGHEAQLKQAKIAYYNGNFEYAKALLDVLKGSTSKLIANDAFELAQLISDNTALDTSTTAMEIFARGDLLLAQGKKNEAIAIYDSIPKLFPGHSLEDEILMRKAEIARSEHNDEQMIQYLQEIENRFSYEIYADKAIFTLAEYYDNAGDTEKAKEKYKRLVFEYPNSIYSAPARNRYRELDKKETIVTP